MVELPEHKAAEGERDAPERAAAPPEPKHPSETVQAGRREQVVGAANQDEGESTGRGSSATMLGG